jgi:hypothetical protein
MERRLESEITIGKAWSLELRHAQDIKAYRTISAATQAAPCVLTVEGHGLPEGWPVWITGAQGMTALNRDPGPEHDREGWLAIIVDDDHIELNRLNASRLPAYVANSARLETFPPADLTGHSARWRLLRSDTDSGSALITKTSPTGIALDNTDKLIRVNVSADDTTGLVAGIRWQVFELFNADGLTMARAEGPVRVAP